MKPINKIEKNEILNQHKDFKKILEEKKISLNKGLMVEQRSQDPIFLDKFTMNQVISKCVTNPGIKAIYTTFTGKDGVVKPAIKVNSGPDNVKIYTNEPNTNFGGYNSYILNTDETKILKGPMSWKCSKLYQEEDNKKTQEQQGLTANQKQFTDGLINQGYIISPSIWDIKSKNLKRVDLTTIRGIEKYFPNGLDVFYDPTTLKGSNITGYKERAAKMTPDVNSCKDFVQTYFNDASGGGAGDLEDTKFVDLKEKVQSCANKWYPKWEGLSGGLLGMANGQNHLNDMIDVLTGHKDIYKGFRTPSRATGWGLTPPPRER